MVDGSIPQPPLILLNAGLTSVSLVYQDLCIKVIIVHILDIRCRPRSRNHPSASVPFLFSLSGSLDSRQPIAATTDLSFSVSSGFREAVLCYRGACICVYVGHVSLESWC